MAVANIVIYNLKGSESEKKTSTPQVNAHAREDAFVFEILKFFTWRLTILPVWEYYCAAYIRILVCSVIDIYGSVDHVGLRGGCICSVVNPLASCMRAE